MGIITDTVFVKLCGTNIPYYESKNYYIPKIIDSHGIPRVKRGTIIEVSIYDLAPNANINIKVKCDSCGIEKEIIWADYNKDLLNDNLYYCITCSRCSDKKWVSLEEWCNLNNRQDVLDRWDYKLNNCKPSKISYKTTRSYYFICPNNIEHSSTKQSITRFVIYKNDSIKCNQCNSFAQWGIDNLGEDFLEKYWDYEKNIVDPWEISHGNSIDKVWIKCQEKDYHSSYDIVCNDFVKGNRCPYCSNMRGKVHMLDSLGCLYPEVLKTWSDKNEMSAFEYAPMSGKYIWLKCKNQKHNDYYTSINNANKANFNCPECVNERQESFLQEKVRLYLENLHYDLLHEHKCTILPINPKTNHYLPYDNEIIDLKCIIEVHGHQHYNEYSGKWFNEKFDLHRQQLYDRYKRIYAKSKGYYYLEIPYWTDDKNETWKKMIDDKIEEILT